jgi:hypothetical protein
VTGQPSFEGVGRLDHVVIDGYHRALHFAGLRLGNTRGELLWRLPGTGLDS